jgi:hypothetical protein
MLLGKILLALLMFAIIWLPNIAVFVGTWYRPRWYDYRDPEVMLRVAIAGLTFFCVAWCFSSLLSSPAVAVCAGLVAPFLAWSLTWLAMWAHGFEHYAGRYRYVDGIFGYEVLLEEVVLQFWAHAICLTASAICFAVGAWIYLRRTEA